jgi:hypothetical protein
LNFLKFDPLTLLSRPLETGLEAPEHPVVIPNECEGSKTDFSLRSKQGFLGAPEMTEA